MFKKVLIAEDQEVANLSVQKTLQELQIADIKYVYYCDDALTWVKNALRDGQAYDLLITDLIFEEDHQAQNLSGGMELIKAVKAVQPDIKIIVFSAESRTVIIEELFKEHAIDGYVRKARRDAQHLKEAIFAIQNNRIYHPLELRKPFNHNVQQVSSVEIAILKFLAAGEKQKNIPLKLKEMKLKPASLSSVEKSLSGLKESFAMSTNQQLIAHCKDIGLL